MVLLTHSANLLVKHNSNKGCFPKLISNFNNCRDENHNKNVTTRYNNLKHQQNFFFSDDSNTTLAKDATNKADFRNPRTNIRFDNSCVHTDVKARNNKIGGETATTTTSSSFRTEGKMTSLSLASKKRRGQKITMVTAYDYPSAMHVDRANVDVLLVGDSCAMVELGYDTTQPLTMEEILHHCRAVRRGASNGPLLVGDLPLGSYEVSDQEALTNSYRFIKEAGMDAVKLEGGSEGRAQTVKTIVEGGVAVMGHIGLTPQAISVIGGFRAQGRTAIRARALLDEALRLQEAGAFAIVIECVPAQVAKAITETLEVPTIGIGAGPHTSGQVLVFHDMLGMMSHPHHEHFVPKFCKKYARVGDAITKGLADFCKDVQEGIFPGKDFSPYVMTEKEEKAFAALLEKDAEKRELIHELAALRLKNADEYETLDLYGKTEK